MPNTCAARVFANFQAVEARPPLITGCVNDPIFELCDSIRVASFSLHQHLRHGHLEKVYENGLSHRLRLQGVNVAQQHPLEVRDVDGFMLGQLTADLFVEHRLIVEVKACRALANEHFAQLLGYLRASSVPHGLVINFGSPKLEVRKFILSDST